MWNVTSGQGKGQQGSVQSYAREDVSLSFHLSSKWNYCFFFWRSHVFPLAFCLLLYRYASRLVFDTLWDFLGPSEAFTRGRHQTNEPTNSDKTTKTNATTEPARYGNLFFVLTSIWRHRFEVREFLKCFLLLFCIWLHVNLIALHLRISFSSLAFLVAIYAAIWIVIKPMRHM